MEVHTHAHTERKRLRHYLLEFFMLFLAVFLGFFAENQREHLLNKRYEKRFITSIIRDLKRDSSLLSFSINVRKQNKIMLDSLIMLLHDQHPEIKSGLLYFYGHRMSLRRGPFLPSTQAYENIKNSGSLRIIEKISITDSIGFYYRDAELTRENHEKMNDELNLQYRNMITEILDGSILHKMTEEEDSLQNILEANPPLITTDKKVLNKLSVIAEELNINNNVTLRQYKRLTDRAIRLIKFLQKEYHLENEY